MPRRLGINTLKSKDIFAGLTYVTHHIQPRILYTQIKLLSPSYQNVLPNPDILIINFRRSNTYTLNLSTYPTLLPIDLTNCRLSSCPKTQSSNSSTYGPAKTFIPFGSFRSAEKLFER